MVCFSCQGAGDCASCQGTGYIAGEKPGAVRWDWCPVCWNPVTRRSSGICPACHGLGEEVNVE